MTDSAARQTIRRLMILTLLALGLPGFASAQDSSGAAPGPGELTVAGHEGMLWLVAGQPGQEGGPLEQHFATVDDVSSQIHPATRIPVQLGRIGRGTAAGDALHVFYATDAGASPTPGAHYRYALSGWRREVSLPDQTVPLALAGDSSPRSAGLWAVVQAKTADAVDEAWRRVEAQRQMEPATRPEDSAAAGVGGAILEPLGHAAGTYHLINYDGLHWRPGFAAPGDMRDVWRAWLAVRGDERYLLWRTAESDVEVQFARRVDDAWVMQAGPAGASALTRASLGFVNKQLVFAGLMPAGTGDDTQRCAGWVWLPSVEGTGEGQWSPVPDLLDAQGEPLVLPAGAAIGSFADQLVLARVREGLPEAGFWPVTGGKPSQDFRKIPVSPTGGPAGREQTTADLLGMLILATIVFLVFWRRQDSIAYPVALPADLMLAGFGRRIVAAVIDLLPAAVVMFVFWHEPLREFVRTLRSHDQFANEARRMLTSPAESVFWAWLTFRLVYAGYAGLFELIGGTTPGKRLTGCRVISETLEHPTAMQILVRNVMRVLELDPTLYFWLLLLAIFVTRNRQRLGDLLARTVVVVHVEPMAQDESDDQDDPDMPADS